MTGRENRRDARIDTTQRVWVEGQDVRVTAQARNMSKGGMFVVTEGSAHSLGNRVEISFDDPLEGRITLDMEIVWKGEQNAQGHLGLRAIDDERAATFARVVSRYLSHAGIAEDGSRASEETARKKASAPSMADAQEAAPSDSKPVP